MMRREIHEKRANLSIQTTEMRVIAHGGYSNTVIALYNPRLWIIQKSDQILPIVYFILCLQIHHHMLMRASPSQYPTPVLSPQIAANEKSP